MKKIIIFIGLVTFLLVSMVAAEVRVASLSPGVVVYYYTSIQTTQATPILEPIPLTITTETPVTKIISENKTLGVIQVEIKLMENSLPILVWVKIIDIKYR
jgi:flagellar basal body-associated protein FliL